MRQRYEKKLKHLLSESKNFECKDKEKHKFHKLVYHLLVKFMLLGVLGCYFFTT